MTFNKLKATYMIESEISDGGEKELKAIEKAARTCYKSEGLITEDLTSAKNIIAKLIKSGHEAMLEHSQLTIRFIVDRGISHELVRHRIASFAQESTRYCNYSSDKFDNTVSIIDISTGMKFDMKISQLDEEIQNKIYNEWVQAMEDAQKHYLKMLELGATPQIARSVLSNSTKTEVVMSTNYREWRNFFKLRTASTAHPQMREITIPLLNELKERIPVIFDDIEVN